MKRLTTAALAVILAGCGFGTGSEFKSGVPSAKEVELTLPQKSGSALSGEGTRKDGLEGDIATFYQVTRGVTVMVNGATVAVLGLVKAITNETPTTETQDQAVWGPHTDPLSPNTWRLTVNKVRAGEYTYALEGRGKNEADTAFRTVLSGSHQHLGNNLGTGSFLLDFNVAKTLPEHDQNVGSVTVTYSRQTATSQVSIEAVFSQVRDNETGQLVDANYLYHATPGSGGNFEFTLKKNLVAGALIETATINSRWQETGAGRADVRARNGDLPNEVTASECWDSNFASRYMLTSYDPSANYGQASACAFQTAQFSTLTL